MRIMLQDEADATMYGGELAPGGPPTSSALLLLVPVVQLEATLRSIQPRLADPTKWASIVTVLSSGELTPCPPLRYPPSYAHAPSGILISHEVGLHRDRTQLRCGETNRETHTLPPFRYPPSGILMSLRCAPSNRALRTPRSGHRSSG